MSGGILYMPVVVNSGHVGCLLSAHAYIAVHAPRASHMSARRRSTRRVAGRIGGARDMPFASCSRVRSALVARTRDESSSSASRSRRRSSSASTSAALAVTT